jgi:hypothetical protein
VSEVDPEVPKLPRGRGLKLSGPVLFRVVLTGAVLVAVLILAKPCGNAVSTFMMGFDKKAGSGSAKQPAAAPSAPGSAGDYVELRPGMTDEETRQKIEQAKAKARAREGSSATP